MSDVTFVYWEITGLTYEPCYHPELIESYRLTLCLCFSFWGDGCISVELPPSTRGRGGLLISALIMGSK